MLSLKFLCGGLFDSSEIPDIVRSLQHGQIGRRSLPIGDISSMIGTD